MLPTIPAVLGPAADPALVQQMQTGSRPWRVGPEIRRPRFGRRAAAAAAVDAESHSRFGDNHAVCLSEPYLFNLSFYLSLVDGFGFIKRPV